MDEMTTQSSALAAPHWLVTTLDSKVLDLLAQLQRRARITEHRAMEDNTRIVHFGSAR